MVCHPVFHELLLLGLLWLCVTFYWLWPWHQAATDQAHGKRARQSTRRSKDPKPFPGLIRKPTCGACEQAQERLDSSPCAPPLTAHTRGRRRQVDTQHQFCPEPSCRYYGWMGRGNLRANGHPGGGPWRQLQCVVCGTYFLETHGTLFHGTRLPTELLVRVVAALAEGLGIRAVARMFEVDPNTVPAWLVEAAEHLEAFSHYFLHDVHLNQVQLDELFALVSTVKAGQ
jgi:hypothetical protein